MARYIAVRGRYLRSRQRSHAHGAMLSVYVLHAAGSFVRSQVCTATMLVGTYGDAPVWSRAPALLG